MALEKVWCKFSVTKSDGSVINLRIQDMPSDRLNDAVDMNICYFSPEETFHRAAGKLFTPFLFLKTITKVIYLYKMKVIIFSCFICYSLGYFMKLSCELFRTVCILILYVNSVRRKG